MNTQEEISDMKARVAEYEAAQLAQQIPAGWTPVIPGARTFCREGSPVALTTDGKTWIAYMKVGTNAVQFASTTPAGALRELAYGLRKAASDVESAL